MDISKFVTLGEDGNIKIDENAFKSEFDSAISKAVEKNKVKVEAEVSAKVRKQLEEEAKMSAEEKLSKEKEKLQKERVEFEKSIAQAKSEIAREKAKTKIPDGLFDNETLEQILLMVNNEEDISKVDKLVSSFNSKIEDAKNKVREEYTAGTPSPNNGGTTITGDAGANFIKNAAHNPGGVTAFTKK